MRARGSDDRAVHGLTLLAAARGGQLEGEGISPRLVVGYGVDLPWASVGVRLQGGSVDGRAEDAAADRRHDSLALGLTLQRFVDLRDLSLSFGLIAEAELHQQVFTGTRELDDRRSLGLAFGGLFSAERHIGHGLALRLEGGPTTALYPLTRRSPEDRSQETTLQAKLTLWAAAGVVWRL